MILFKAPDSTSMAALVYPELAMTGWKNDSRNGKVIQFDNPISMCFTNPRNRANFTRHRNANPFFHIAEAMWMLAGRRDVAFLTKFNKNMVNYSDDGETFNAAYGYRLRHHFGIDQLKEIVNILRKDPNSRQAIGTIWDPNDLIKDTKDKACNMTLVFSVMDKHLRLVVYNRSNDLVYGGVTGANPVHFSFIQQWVADQLELPMEYLYFVSANAHVYTDLYPHWDYVQKGTCTNKFFNAAYLSLGELSEIEHLCNEIMEDGILTSTFKSNMLEKAVKPILNCWLERKAGLSFEESLNKCIDTPLYYACWNWLEEHK